MTNECIVCGRSDCIMQCPWCLLRRNEIVSICGYKCESEHYKTCAARGGTTMIRCTFQEAVKRLATNPEARASTDGLEHQRHKVERGVLYGFLPGCESHAKQVPVVPEMFDWNWYVTDPPPKTRVREMAEKFAGGHAAEGPERFGREVVDAVCEWLARDQLLTTADRVRREFLEPRSR